MTETKRQHFLPFVYLKYFRCKPHLSRRDDATILRDDGVTVNEEKIENQCYSSWFYRRTKTQESENAFGTFESDWNEIVSRARNGIDERALVFSQIVLYHFRNLSIRILTSEMDRFTAVQGSIFSFIEQKILKLERGVKYTDDPKHVTEFPWHVKLVTFPSAILLTSDNPSVMTIGDRKKVDYGPFFLPISPREIFVAFDPKKYLFTEGEPGNESDAFLANAYVAAQSKKHVYYSNPMPAALRANLWEFIGRNRAAATGCGFIDGQQFTPGHALYPANAGQKFSFLNERG